MQVNRKSQTIFHLDDSDSDDDPDLANQSLSQSMMRSNGMHLGYSKSFQVVNGRTTLLLNRIMIRPINR